MSLLEINGLSLFSEESKILRDLSLEIEEGGISALIGPNGAGKSSLAYLIMGLEGYDNFEGNLVFRGESLKGLDVYERSKRGITLAWQEPARFEGLTVRNFLESATEDDGKDPEEALEKMGMSPENYLERTLDESLSGGERKKIELASVIAMQPRLVLLDEPDSGIDVSSLDKIYEALDLLKEEGATVILITHSADALEKADHTFLMCCGSIVDEGSPEKIKKYFEEKCIPCDHLDKFQEREEDTQ